MDKPKPDGRPDDWTEKLKSEIDKALGGQSAVELIWAWDSLVKDASAAINASLTTVAAEQAGTDLKNNLKSALQRLTRAQGENDLSPDIAPRHFVTVLADLLSDQVEQMDGAILTPHGAWLAADPATAATAGFAAQMNGLLLTAGVSNEGIRFEPGTVYRFMHTNAFAAHFGNSVSSLVEMLCNAGPQSEKRQVWRAAVKPVVVEVSPICDVAQNHRVTSFLVAGLIVPEANKNEIKMGDAFAKLPVFRLRWPAQDFPVQDAILVFCHRYKATFPVSSAPVSSAPDWLQPWFRLREMPTASLRNAQSGHGSRVGFVSLHD